MSIILYDLPPSAWCQKVRIALAEKEVSYARRIVRPGEHLEPWFVALNPLHKVPVLVHDGLVVRESTIIVEYLDEVFRATPSLYGDDPRTRARVRLMEDLADEHVCAVVYELFMELGPRGNPGGAEAELRLRDAVARAFDVLESALDPGGPWALGEAFSAADVALAPFLVGYAPRARVEAAIDRRPRIAALTASLRARPSVGIVEGAWAEWTAMSCADDPAVAQANA